MPYNIVSIVLSFILLIIFQNPAYAYLDPGTGNMILQALVGLLAAGATAVSIYWQKFKIFMNKIFKKKDTIKSDK